jgi:hypothetical protein
MMPNRRSSLSRIAGGSRHRNLALTPRVVVRGCGEGGSLLIIPAVIVLAIACGSAPPIVAPVEEAADPPRLHHAIALRLEEGETDTNETPHTRVALVHIAPSGEREVHELGIEPGLCYHTELSDTLIAAECWWAGAGARFGLRRERSAVIALRVDVDEETGASEAREIVRVEIPRGAELDVLAPGRSVLDH